MMQPEQLRELDARVAEARGWRVISRCGSAAIIQKECPPISGVYDPWSPTTNIADAMELVEDMWCFDVSGSTPSGQFNSWVQPTPDDDPIAAYACRTPSLAITLAYAKAKGIEIPDE